MSTSPSPAAVVSLVAGLLAGLAGAPLLHAQAQEPPKPQMLPPLSVEVVRIEVVATEKGRPKPGLGREDFTVLEDGKPQAIVQFQAFTRPARGAPAPPSPPAGAEAAEEAQELLPARYVLLAIDDVHLEFASLVRVRKAVGRFLEADLRPEDQVALVTTSGAGAISLEFTADRAVLRQTLSRLSVQERRTGWSGVPYMSEYQAELIESGDPLALDAAAQEIMAAGLFQDLGSAEEEARRKARVMLAEAVYNSRLTLETLDSLTRGLAGLSGRKVILLVSDGFLTGLSAGSGAGFDLRRVADAATKTGVVLYALDTRGLIAAPPAASASSLTRVQPATLGLIESMQRRGFEATRDAMHALAADTGGFLVDNSNNLRAGLTKILDDTETYYVLAYEPNNTKRDGGFRRIEVRLPGLRGVKLRTRSGYFAPDDRRASRTQGTPEAARRAEQRQAEMRTALNALAPLRGIPVRLSADFVSVESGVSQVVVSGQVDTTTLPFVRQHDRHQATIDTVAVVYDEAGTVATTLQTERTTMDLTDADYEQALKQGLPYQQATALEPGRYQVRLAAREDTTGLLGSAWQWVEIPDLAPGRLTLSSLFLLKQGEADAVAASSPEPGPVLQNAQAVRRFRRGESLYLQLYAYNAKRDAAGATDLVSQAEVLRGGVLLGTAAPEPIVQGEPQGPPLPHTSRIKLERFEPGDYELRVTVTDRHASAMATRRVAFSIE